MCFAFWKLAEGFYEHELQRNSPLCIISWSFCPNSKQIQEVLLSDLFSGRLSSGPTSHVRTGTTQLKWQAAGAHYHLATKMDNGALLLKRHLSMKEHFMKKQCRQAHQLHLRENLDAYMEVTNKRSLPSGDCWWWGDNYLKFLSFCSNFCVYLKCTFEVSPCVYNFCSSSSISVLCGSSNSLWLLL